MTRNFLVPVLLPADPANDLEAATKHYVDINTGGDFTQVEADALYVNLSGDTMVAALTLPATDPTADNHAARKLYVDTQRDTRVAKTGDTLTGLLVAPASRSGTLNLNDDQALSITFDAPARGMMVITPSTNAGGSALVSFRCGDATNSFVTVLASGGATVGGGTGGLTGTSGTDGNLTIRATTASNMIYIENRTGAVRGYSWQFLANQGGVPGGPTLV